MKRNLIAAACAALGSAAAFAAPLATNTGVPANLVTYYIAGASAQAQAVAAVLPTAAFFAAPADVVKLTGGSVNDARYGMSNPAVTGGVSKPLLIVYRNSNGSGSGVRQLLAKGATTAAKNANILTIPAVGGVAVNADNTNLVSLATCGAVTGAAGSYTAACTSLQTLAPDVALSDVAAIELAGNFPAAGANFYAKSELLATRNALQGFGIVVNPAAYAALQAQNIADGSLPASCASSSAITCQPSIRKADYASLISAEGSIKDSAGLFNGAAAAGEVTICRRVDTSGTQATSNLFFLNNVCGTSGFGGFFSPLGAADSAAGQIVWNEASSTTNVKACVNNASGYRLGVVSLENVPAGSDTYKFVKIDGVSPNFANDGSLAVPAVVADTKQRQQFANGSYPYALEMYSMVQPSASADVVAFSGALNTKLGDSTASDLVGIAYFDLPGTWAGNSLTNKQTKVTHAGNNCGPLLP
jgi:hypothetical protein